MHPVLRALLFFLMVLLVWGGGHAYLGWRFLRPSRLKPRLRRAAWVGLSTLALLPPVVMVIGRVVGTTEGVLAWVGFLAMGLSSLLISFALMADVTRWGIRGVHKLTGPSLPHDPQRRAFLNDVVGLGVLGSSATLTGAGVAEAVRTPRVVDVEVPIEGLAPELEGFRIVQLTDVHIGPTIRGPFLDGVVDRVNGLQADLVAVTGDLVDGFVDELRDHVAPLGRLRARHGAFFVTGNHEYYWDPLPWCEEVQRLGLTVLNNEHRIVDHGGRPMVVAGCTDHRAGAHLREHASDPGAALRGAPEGAFKLLLAHQPRSLFAAAEAGADLQISGHTHAGQYFPMTWLIHLFQPFVAGLHRFQRTWIYVSRGTGYWGPPLRIGSPSEITVLRLVAA